MANTIITGITITYEDDPNWRHQINLSLYAQDEIRVQYDISSWGETDTELTKGITLQNLFEILTNSKDSLAIITARASVQDTLTKLEEEVNRLEKELKQVKVNFAVVAEENRSLREVIKICDHNKFEWEM